MMNWRRLSAGKEEERSLFVDGEAFRRRRKRRVFQTRIVLWNEQV